MGNIFGYCRISTPKQNLERQVRNILQMFPDAKIYKDTWTGRTNDRPEWGKILRQLRAGDTVVFDSVSRMSRSAADGFQMYMDLYNKGVNLVFLKERHIDTDSYKEAMQGVIAQNHFNFGGDAVGEFMTAIMEAINVFMLKKVEQDIFKAFEQSQKEVDDLRQRTREGVLTAKLNGKQVGRAPGAHVITKKERDAKAVIAKHSRTFGGALTDPECIRLAGCSRNSYYKYKRELLDDLRPQDPMDDFFSEIM